MKFKKQVVEIQMMHELKTHCNSEDLHVLVKAKD